MQISRRNFLKMMGGMTGAGLAALAMPARPAQAAPLAEESASMLYDASKCIGCRACQTACKERAGLPHEPDQAGLYEAPAELTASTWTLIQLYQGEKGRSFIKHQCMHCIEPACVSVCPVAALEKLESGPVVYHAERCIGCRYCMAACPFNVPKSEWDKPLPLIQKCDFCADRQAEGLEPLCGEVCPTGALISGSRKSMLSIARERLEKDITYFPHVYGETEAGGTSMLYIAKTDYQNLGFPDLDEYALPTITWPYMRAVPAVVAVMVGLSTAIYLRTHRRDNGAEKED